LENDTKYRIFDAKKVAELALNENSTLNLRRSTIKFLMAGCAFGFPSWDKQITKKTEASNPIYRSFLKPIRLFLLLKNAILEVQRLRFLFLNGG
jgi:hypothetical protein